MPLDDVIQPDPGPARDLWQRFGHLRDAELIGAMAGEAFPGRLAVASSFGIESAVLLRLVAEAAPDLPVLFLNTGMLFAQTEQYQRHLSEHLGLTDVRVIGPDPDHVAEYDPDKKLHQRDPDLCCHLRKVLPMQRALSEFDAWITGRKRYQGGQRTALPLIEHDGRHIKINPLADWDADRIREAFERCDLPRHPLEEAGYTSVGCFPCTSFAQPGSDARSGRWAGSEKTECGIHNAPWAGGGI
ncbi:MAG: phosphoadenylyl-sulfate reductase [Rhodospirillales bacterium]